MRGPGLVLVSALAAVLAAATPAAPAAADPTPKPGEKLCEFSDQRLAQISGLVATDKGYTAVSDGGEVLEVFDLNRKCGVVERHSFQLNPFDPEDLAIAKDGTLWVADTGDNDTERPTVALWKISPDRSNAAIYRMTYPEGKKYDAEALLMEPDGTPVIVTKDLDGAGVSGIYVAKTPLKEGESVPLTKAGELTFKSTGTTGNRFGVVGQRLVTGGAVSADGKRAILRTYSDAYEWKVTKGDVVAALTKSKSKSVRTPLPGEAQGEAITLSVDGKKYLTASEAAGQNTPAAMFSYTPYQAPPPKPKKTEAASAGWFSGLSLQDVKWIIAGLGVLGLVLVVVGVFGIRHARSLVARRGRRSAASRAPSRSDGGPRRASPDPTETAELSMGGAFDDLRSDDPLARGGWGADSGRDAPGDELGPRNAQGRVRRTEPTPRGEPPGRSYGSASGRAPRPRPADTPRARYSRGDGDDPRYRRPPSGGGWPR